MKVDVSFLRENPKKIDEYIAEHHEEFTEKDLAWLLENGHGIMGEDDYTRPGEEITKGIIAGPQIGVGANAVVFEIKISEMHGNEEDLKKLSGLTQAYDAMQDLVGKVRRQTSLFKATKSGENSNDRRLQTLELLQKRIDYFLSQTRPIHNTHDLQELASTMYGETNSYKAMQFVKGAAKLKHKPVSDLERANIEKEFLIQKALNEPSGHPSIPRVGGSLIETDSLLGFRVGHLDARTLEGVVDKQEKSWRLNGEEHLIPEMVLKSGIEAADVFDFMQSKGISYMDVQLGNFMIGFDGRLYLVDFGKADQIYSDKRIRVIGGDLRYFAPETIKGAREGSGHEGAEYHSKTAGFSLSALLFRIATNDMPFEGDRDTVPKLKRNIIGCKYTDPRSMHPELKKWYSEKDIYALFKIMFVPNPNDRPSLHEWGDILRERLRQRTDKSTLEIGYDFMQGPSKVRNMFYKGVPMEPAPIGKPKRNMDDD